MNVDGWIPREQILDDEARSKVPEEYIILHPTNGNPPTLFLVLRDLFIKHTNGCVTILTLSLECPDTDLWQIACIQSQSFFRRNMNLGRYDNRNRHLHLGMHFDDAHGTYLDFGNHTEKVEICVGKGNEKRNVNGIQADVISHFHSFSLSKSLTKSMIQIQDSTILEQQLSLISNRSILWTDYGLRSLSKTR
ncbi:hypothetical protein HYC85_009444 [Camellia sinensis]|uniref:Glycosyl hydrolase family 63 C-terminal domain-containing protein n=1 Tax=Camellia sinensis TaxID=4442 RepID=A0A7J7HF07_CAMSI|nr:hypothetical protein HYC85_009444 [Camellia sinensis]